MAEKAEKQDHDKYDPRLESLVMETRTFWDPEVGELSDNDRKRLSEALHQKPAEATKIHYERSHTGFTREITVTAHDVERLKSQRLGASR